MELNAQPVYPADFPEWADTMNNWGKLMLNGINTVSQMLALGLDFPVDTFASMLNNGPHLLAPTGSDLSKYHNLDTIFAGFHYDLNFLTIHGKSRFPGLYIWLRDGRKIPVKVPDGCLLIQAGKQLEILTGGYITAGYHEVVFTELTRQALEKAEKENKILWRVSSTLFGHIQSDQILKPLGKFATSESISKYPEIETGKQVEEELQLINLKTN